MATAGNIKDTGRDKLGETYGRQSQFKQHETLLERSSDAFALIDHLEGTIYSCPLLRLCKNLVPSTYGHSQLKTGHPVRSAIHKQLNGRLVLRWVTTWESLLL
ncbi:hypothetical protein KCU65_g8087, partial [Aureobasidium melanogenum]